MAATLSDWTSAVAGTYANAQTYLGNIDALVLDFTASIGGVAQDSNSRTGVIASTLSSWAGALTGSAFVPLGALNDGATLTITGSGFGTKSQAAPLHFDRFESGTAGASLTTSNTPTVGNPYISVSTLPPKYDSTAFSGSKSLLMDYTQDTTTSGIDARVSLGGVRQEVYYSYRMRKTIVGTQNTSSGDWNIKFARVGPAVTNFDVATNAPIFDNYSEINGTAQSGPTGITIREYGSSDNVAWFGAPLSWDAWHRLEGYCKLPSPFNTNTGERYCKRNGISAGTNSSYPGGNFADPNATGISTSAYEGAPWNTFTGSTGFLGFERFITPFYCRQSYSIKLWIDELWIDSTQARVEIGNAATWNACTKRSPQPATAWSNTSITVTLNKGDQTAGQTAYAFVVTTDGTILELGSVGEWA
jgi:hypothetical protein